MSNIDFNAIQLREIAQRHRDESNALYDIKEKIYKEAEKGKVYLKTGFKIEYLKQLKKYCHEKQLLFKDHGNDSSGSEFTTIVIDWSIDGTGTLR